jgi:hypothetical protein
VIFLIIRIVTTHDGLNVAQRKTQRKAESEECDTSLEVANRRQKPQMKHAYTPEEKFIIEKAINQICALAKDLPLRDARDFLRGVSMMAEDCHPAECITEAYGHVQASMRLLATPLEAQ